MVRRVFHDAVVANGRLPTDIRAKNSIPIIKQFAKDRLIFLRLELKEDKLLLDSFHAYIGVHLARPSRNWTSPRAVKQRVSAWPQKTSGSKINESRF